MDHGWYARLPTTALSPQRITISIGSVLLLLSVGVDREDGEFQVYIAAAESDAGGRRCFSYTCLKRLMTFWAAVRTGEGYSVFFTGTAPQGLRINLLNANPAEKMLIRIYFQTSSRLQVLVQLLRGTKGFSYSIQNV
jgi:hypothetical protein